MPTRARVDIQELLQDHRPILPVRGGPLGGARGLKARPSGSGSADGREAAAGLASRSADNAAASIKAMAAEAASYTAKGKALAREAATRAAYAEVAAKRARVRQADANSQQTAVEAVEAWELCLRKLGAAAMCYAEYQTTLVDVLQAERATQGRGFRNPTAAEKESMGDPVLEF
eukprot:9462531-Pyramimonas_sp.AAC.1